MINEQLPAIGIDFGTSNSSMAWYDPRTERAEVILNAEGQSKTPSLVYYGEGETLVGDTVTNLLDDVSTDTGRREDTFQRTIKSIKRNLLAPPVIALPGGRYVRPADVASEVLGKLKRDAEDGLFHEEVRRAVITCPAEFNVKQREQIEKAGHQAGFEEVVLLEEPVAGALAYARAGLNVGKHVLVYDLGGGTFDLAVLDNEDESFHVAMDPKGIEHCGGDDFDNALYQYCDDLAKRELGRPISMTGTLDLGFLRECQKRKESLSFQDRGRFSSYLSSEDGPTRFEHEMDRQTFEGLIGGYVETTTRLTEEILKQAGEAGHEVDTVVLVGGSSRVRLVVRTLQETLPVSPLGFDKKDVAVALGAAHYTNIRWAPPKVSRGGTTSSWTSSPTLREPVVSDSAPLRQYERAVEETYANRKLDKLELHRLSALATQLRLSREQTADVERRVMGDSKEGVLYAQYRQAVEMLWEDGKLNGLEVEWLVALADELGLGREQSSHAESEVMGAAKESVLGRGRPAPETTDGQEGFVLAHVLSGHAGEVHAVSFSPDGQFLASGSSDHAVRGWNARTGQPVGALAGHTGRVNSVGFNVDGSLLASGGFDKSVRVWKLPNGEPFHTLHHPAWVFCVSFSPDNRILISGGADKEIRLWNLGTGELLRTATGHSHWVLSLDVSPDGRALISGGADSTARVWNPETGEPLHAAFEHPDWVRSVAVGPDGRLLATACDDGAVRVWDLGSGELVRTTAAHSGPVLSVAVSPDGQLLHSGGSDGKIKVWSAQTGEPVHILPGHLMEVGSVAPSPDGRLLASGGYDHAIKVWNKGLLASDPVPVDERRPVDPPPYPPNRPPMPNSPPHGPGSVTGRPPQMPPPGPLGRPPVGPPGRPQDLPD